MAGTHIYMCKQGKKLDSEVLAPMQRWTTAYNTVQVSFSSAASTVACDPLMKVKSLIDG